MSNANGDRGNAYITLCDCYKHGIGAHVSEKLLLENRAKAYMLHRTEPWAQVGDMARMELLIAPFTVVFALFSPLPILKENKKCLWARTPDGVLRILLIVTGVDQIKSVSDTLPF
jgi:hypothetical protein